MTLSALLLVFAFYLKAHFDSQFLVSPIIDLSFVFISIPLIILALRTELFKVTGSSSCQVKKDRGENRREIQHNKILNNVIISNL